MLLCNLNLMDIEIITPAGRKRYLEILYRHLAKQKNDFNNWVLWINTSNQEDINYCKQLEKENNWIKTLDSKIPPNVPSSIYHFYKYSGCDPNKVYIRFDDDIVWLSDNFIKELATFRIENPEYFLVYPNIINNSLIDSLNQRFGSLQLSHVIKYKCFDAHGWVNYFITKKKHEYFLKSILENDTKKFEFGKWILNNNERVSINCISWLGSEFAKFKGIVGEDEEQWLSVEKPLQVKKYNIIYGKPICSHYAFYLQRDYIDKETNILKRYNDLI